MAESKKMFSRLDEFFSRIRSQNPVMDLHDVEALIEKQLPVAAKKSVGAWRILGIVSLIGLANLGIIWLWNAESGNKKITNTVAVTENTRSANSLASEEKNNPTTNSLIDEPDKNVEAAFEDPSKNNPENITVVKTEPKNSAPIRVTVKSATINFGYKDQKIRMIVASDNEVGELIINNEAISPEDFIHHKDVIAEGLKIKKQNQKENTPVTLLTEKEKEDNKVRRLLMNEMVKQLSSDKLIHGNEPFDFRLTGNELFLDGQKQNPEIFEQYKNHFQKITGELLPESYNLHIRR
ncbi:MAG: hypothetical protein ACHQNT_03470 [Bacteroidia bacterium]